MSQHTLAEQRNALLDRHVRFCRMSLDLEKEGHEIVHRLSQSPHHVEDIALKMVATWTKKETLAFEPCLYEGRESGCTAQILFGIRIRQMFTESTLKDKLGIGVALDTRTSGLAYRFQTFLTDTGVQYLLVWNDDVAQSRTFLSWSDFVNWQFSPLRISTGKSMYQAMEDWVRSQLTHDGHDFAEECVEKVENWYHDSGLCAKRQFPHLYFSNGQKTRYCASTQDLCGAARIWLFGAMAMQDHWIEWSSSGDRCNQVCCSELSPWSITFTCTKDGEPSTIPCSPRDIALRPRHAWAEILQCDVEHYDDCLNKALDDSYFMEAVSNYTSTLSWLSPHTHTAAPDGVDFVLVDSSESDSDEKLKKDEDMTTKMDEAAEQTECAAESTRDTMHSGIVGNLQLDEALGWQSTEFFECHYPQWQQLQEWQLAEWDTWFAHETAGWDLSMYTSNEIIQIAKTYEGTLWLQGLVKTACLNDGLQSMLIVASHLQAFMFDGKALFIIEALLTRLLDVPEDFNDGPLSPATLCNTVILNFEDVTLGRTSAYSYKVVMWMLEFLYMKSSDKLKDICDIALVFARKLVTSNYGHLVLQHALLFTEKALVRAATKARRKDWIHLRKGFFTHALSGLSDQRIWDNRSSNAGHFINKCLELLQVGTQVECTDEHLMESRAEILRVATENHELYGFMCAHPSGQYTARRIYEMADQSQKKVLEKLSLNVGRKVWRVELCSLTKFNKSILDAEELDFPTFKFTSTLGSFQ